MNYLANFTSKCLSEGKSSMSDIAEAARSRLKEVNRQISSLQQEEKELKSLLKQFGGDVKAPEVAYIEANASFDSLHKYVQQICFQIVEFIELNQNVSVRNIIDAVSTLEDSKFVLTSLKWLIDSKILKKSSIDRKISQGDLWQERNALLKIISLKD